MKLSTAKETKNEEGSGGLGKSGVRLCSYTSVSVSLMLTVSQQPDCSMEALEHMVIHMPEHMHSDRQACFCSLLVLCLPAVLQYEQIRLLCFHFVFLRLSFKCFLCLNACTGPVSVHYRVLLLGPLLILGSSRGAAAV